MKKERSNQIFDSRRKITEHLHTFTFLPRDIETNEKLTWNGIFHSRQRLDREEKSSPNVSSVDETKETVVSNRWTKRSIKLQVGKIKVKIVPPR